MNASQTNMTEFSIHPATRIGMVALKVANLEDQIAFYQQALGFRLNWQEGKHAGLGAGGRTCYIWLSNPVRRDTGGQPGCTTLR